ncbi:uncharacterized protein LOC132302713 isoform X2 [Cornus florida]|uniref:uncharacterized protein LOC132302713 isoform X2 n=1 Tax=Cornus florida TaxID=4283 RepID=UPI0028975389|nr:uncharacterized protein LOC132302713 isoform X2 [Cornus florida]
MIMRAFTQKFKNQSCRGIYTEVREPGLQILLPDDYLYRIMRCLSSSSFFYLWVSMAGRSTVSAVSHLVGLAFGSWWGVDGQLIWPPHALLWGVEMSYMSSMPASGVYGVCVVVLYGFLVGRLWRSVVGYSVGEVVTSWLTCGDVFSQRSFGCWRARSLMFCLCVRKGRYVSFDVSFFFSFLVGMAFASFGSLCMAVHFYLWVVVFGGVSFCVCAASCPL